MENTPSMETLTRSLSDGQDLSRADISSAAEALLGGEVTDEEKAGFLAALARKGESPAEIAGFAEEFLGRAVDPGLDPARVGKPLLDVCGTGGDKLNTFNVSTTSVFLLAAAGVAVVKHGNRGITSKSGGADVLEALGIRIDLPPEDFCRCVEEVGAGFLFAPLYHPAFKAVAPVRKILAQRGQRTIFNLLGPLLNPARPDFQVIGVFDGRLGPAFAEILGHLGRTRAWAVHGKTETGAGMDELSPLGPTRVWEIHDNQHSDTTVAPADLDIAPGTLAELEGGDAQENATLLEGILADEITGPKRDIAALNAAAGLVVAGKAADLAEGLRLANEAIDSGAASEVLRRWREFG